MRSKNLDLMKDIVDFVNQEYYSNGKVPTMQEIADHFHISKSLVFYYIKDMKEKGLIDYDGSARGIKTKTMEKFSQDVEYVPLVGDIACGPQMLAEQNIERYLPIPKGLLGNGKHFALVAEGESMINAGIDNGDFVFIRQQDTAEEGQIVVALIGNEATLKRYYLDRKRKQVRLHPENDNMEDMFFKKIQIQGVAVKVMKDLF